MAAERPQTLPGLVLQGVDGPFQGAGWRERVLQAFEEVRVHRRAARVGGAGRGVAGRRRAKLGLNGRYRPRAFVCISRRRTSFMYVWYFFPRPRNQESTSASTRRLTNCLIGDRKSTRLNSSHLGISYA